MSSELRRARSAALRDEDPPILTKAARRTLSAFVIYGLCAGQREVAALGYAPLPRNLVSAGLLDVARIPGHVAVPALARCYG